MKRHVASFILIYMQEVQLITTLLYKNLVNGRKRELLLFMQHERASNDLINNENKCSVSIINMLQLKSVIG